MSGLPEFAALQLTLTVLLASSMQGLVRALAVSGTLNKRGRNEPTSKLANAKTSRVDRALRLGIYRIIIWASTMIFIFCEFAILSTMIYNDRPLLQKLIYSGLIAPHYNTIETPGE